MIIITSKCNLNNPPLFASGHYYSKTDFQFPITTITQTVIQTTVLRNNPGITLLYFSKGHGKIMVNSKAYPIKRGIFMCLGSYHYFQLIPSSEPIELTQCQLSYDTFIYMAANPYYDFSTITLNVQPLTALLKGDTLKSVEIILKELKERTNINLKKEKINTEKSMGQRRNIIDTSQHKIRKKEFILSMRLMGILHKSFQSDFWSDLKDEGYGNYKK